jgi:hypothetical protein
MKGRKNSTPKVMSTITLSPDGAITSFDRSNLGSLSKINLLIYLESAIGKVSTNVAIFKLSESPSIETMCLLSLEVIVGAVLSEG